MFEGQYIGPTSGIAFLQRARGRLRQDFVSKKLQNAENTVSTPSSVFTFGGIPFGVDQSSLPLVLPSQQQALELVERYFDFAIPTYRFLHQAVVERWLDRFYAEHNEKNTTEHKSKLLTTGKATVVLMVLATATLYRAGPTGMIHDVEAPDCGRR